MKGQKGRPSIPSLPKIDTLSPLTPPPSIRQSQDRGLLLAANADQDRRFRDTIDFLTQQRDTSQWQNQQIAGLQEEKAGLEERLHLANSEREGLNGTIVDFKALNDRLEEELRSTKSANEGLRRDKAEDEGKLQAANANYDQLLDNKIDIEKTLASTTTANNNLQIANASLERQVQDANLRNDRLQKKNSDLDVQLPEANSDNVELGNEKKLWNSRLLTISNEKISLQDDIEELKSEAKQAQVGKEELEDRYDQLQERHGQLEREHVDLQEQLEGLQKQVTELEAKVGQIQKRLISQQQRTSQMAKDALVLIGNLKVEQAEIEERLEEEKALRVQEIKAKDWENVDLRHQQERDKKEIADLRANLNKAHSMRRESADRARKEIEDLEKSVASHKGKWTDEKAALKKTEQKRHDEQRANISLNGHLRIKENNLTNLKAELEQAKTGHAAELDRLKRDHREQVQRGNGRYNEKTKELQRVKDELDGALKANCNVRQAEDNAARYLSAQKEALAKSTGLEKELEKIRKELHEVQTKLKETQNSPHTDALLSIAQQEAKDAQAQLQDAKNTIANLEDELADKEAEALNKEAEELKKAEEELRERQERMRRKRQKPSEAGGDDEREVKRSRSERP